MFQFLIRLKKKWRGGRLPVLTTNYQCIPTIHVYQMDEFFSFPLKITLDVVMYYAFCYN